MSENIVRYKRSEIVRTEGEELPEYISKEEVDRIITGMEKELNKKTTEEGKKRVLRDLLFIQTLWMTGMRASEVTAMRRMDILESGIRVFGKRKPRTKKEMEKGVELHEKRKRIIQIPAMLRQNLINYVFEEKLGSEQRLFPFTTTRVYQIVTKYAKSAGIQRKIFPHMFRHGFAVYYLRHTHSLNSLQQLLGHTNLQSTTIYLKLDSEEIQKYVEGVFGGKIR